MKKTKKTVPNCQNLNTTNFITRLKENSKDLIHESKSSLNTNNRIQSYYDQKMSNHKETIECNIDVTQIEKFVQLAIKEKLSDLNGKCDELEAKLHHSITKNADIISNLSNELGLINKDLEKAYSYLKNSKVGFFCFFSFSYN